VTAQQQMHPGAWWCWGLLTAVGLSGVTNPLLSASVLAALAVVVSARSIKASSRAFSLSLRLGVMLLVVRLFIAVAFGARTGGTVLWSLPSVPLPSWFAGITIGGPVTAPLLLGALYQGLNLAAVLACFGAASTLAPPAELVATLPRSVYELGLSVAIALAFLPELSESAQAVRAARRLRGRPTSGLAGFRGMAIPVLEGALERSVAMAAAMDARGFGRLRSAGTHPRAVPVLAMVGAASVTVGAVGLLSGGVATAVGAALLLSGVVAALWSLRIRSAQFLRTRFTEVPFSWRASVIAGAGACSLLLLLALDRWAPLLVASPTSGGAPSFGIATALLVALVLAPLAVDRGGAQT